MTATTLFESFFDDAAIFPPGLAALDEAVSNNIQRRDHQVSPLVGPLILPVDKISEAAGYAGNEHLEVSAVLNDQDINRLNQFLGQEAPVNNVSIVSAEIKISPDSSEEEWKKRVSNLARVYGGLKVWVELPYENITEEVLRMFADRGLKLKFRTGGIRQELFPTPEQLVEVLSLAVRVGVPFKLTAGLHRAVRYVNPETGFQHFGFLNIVAAVVELQEDNGEPAALHALNSDDSNLLASTVAQSAAWRDSFVSFGTCSVVEPLETLTELGLYSAEDIPSA